eukprot:c11315_g1_i1 orf=43-459(+)
MSYQGEPSSHQQPRQGVQYEKILATLSNVKSILQAKCEQVGKLVYPMWSIVWNKPKTLLPPSSSTEHYEILEEEPKGSLEERYKELKERLARVQAKLEEKHEECERIWHTCGEQVKALNSKMEDLKQKGEERENFLKE